MTHINAHDTRAAMEISIPAIPNRRRKASSDPSKFETPDDESALRHTGIGFMEDMPWGTHVCLFYETPHDLLDTAVCYFEAGLKSNEFCVWAVSDPISLQQAEQASIARRKGSWEFLETPELKRAKLEIRRLNGALDVLSKPFPGHDTLTPKERVALAQNIRGASSKEAARTFGVSPRTVDFHRANLLKKLGARSALSDCLH